MVGQPDASQPYAEKVARLMKLPRKFRGTTVNWRRLVRFNSRIYKANMSGLVEPFTRQGQVQVHFVTDSADIELSEEKRQLLVPTSEHRMSHYETMQLTIL